MIKNLNQSNLRFGFWKELKSEENLKKKMVFIGTKLVTNAGAQKKRALAPREKVALGAGITADVCIIDRSKSDNPFHNFLH